MKKNKSKAVVNKRNKNYYMSGAVDSATCIINSIQNLDKEGVKDSWTTGELVAFLEMTKKNIVSNLKHVK